MEKERNYTKARKTEYKIIDALFTMLDDYGLDQITIQQICDMADIHRSTFYKHFGSIFDVIQCLMQEIASAMSAAAAMDDYMEQAFDGLFEFYKKYGRAIRNIAKTKYRDILDQQICRVTEQFVERIYKSRNEEEDPVIQRWMIQYYAAGMRQMQNIILAENLEDQSIREKLKQFYGILLEKTKKQGE